MKEKVWQLKCFKLRSIKETKKQQQNRSDNSACKKY